MKATILTALAMFALCLTIGAFADEMKKPDQSMDQMMKAMQAYATPGDAQKMMQSMVGTWDTDVKSYMDPSAPPMESKGTSTFTSLMDGRYLQEMAEGNMMGMPFHGMGTYGYDNMQKMYVASWVDNMGTGIMTTMGTSKDGGKTIDYSGMEPDPMSGKMVNFRSVMHMMDADHYHFEMFGPGKDGKEMKMMEITYTRRKM